MKFTCPKCSTRYTIGDDKVPLGAAVRFTCKKCSNVIRLKRRPKEQLPSLATPSPMEPDPGSSTRVATLGEINALKRASADGGSNPTPSGSPSTSVVSPGAVTPAKAEPLRLGDDTPVTAEPEAPPIAPFASSDDWYVMVQGKQRGPHPVTELQGMLRDGLIGPRNYVWKDGMADWARIQAVPELAPPGEATRVAERAPALTPAREADAGPTVALTQERLESELDRARRQTEVAARAAVVPASVEAKSKVDEIALLAALTGEATAIPNIARAGTAELDEFTPFQATPSSGTPNPNGPRPTQPLVRPLSSTPTASQNGPVIPDILNDPNYLQAPPGEATRVFMTTAGIYRHRRRNKVAAVLGITAFVALTTLVSLDAAGIMMMPGMGVVYETAGLEDPNITRAVERVESKLAHAAELPPEEVEKLRQKLAGLSAQVPTHAPKLERAPVVQDAGSGPGVAPVVTEGVKDRPTLSQTDHSLAASIFGDDRKKGVAVDLAPPQEIQTPNLPDGLTQDAIGKVITDNNRSMSMCFAQSMKAGEKLAGKMEVELVIEATGTAADVRIASAAHKSTTFGACTVKTIKRWRFPRFNGEPVTVSFPYVLSMGM